MSTQEALSEPATEPRPAGRPFAALVWFARRTYGREGPLSSALARCGQVCEAFVLIFFTGSLLLLYLLWTSGTAGAASASAGLAACLLFAALSCLAAVGFAAAALSEEEEERGDAKFVINEWRLASLKAAGVNKAIYSYLEWRKGDNERVEFRGEQKFLSELEGEFGEPPVAESKRLLLKHLRA